MESKVTLQRLAALLALSSGKQKKICEDFIREFFKVIAYELENGESVRIKGFGSFKLSNVDSRKSIDVSSGEEMEIPGHRRVLFVPSKELAAVVNAPFSSFETIELPDGFETTDFENLQESEIENDQFEVASATIITNRPENNLSDENEPLVERPECSTETVVYQGNDIETEDSNLKHPDGEESCMDVNAISGYEEPAEIPSNPNDEFDYEPEHGNRFKFVWGFIAGIVTAAVIVGMGSYYSGYPFFNKTPETVAITGIEELKIDKAEVDTVILKKGSVATVPKDGLSGDKEGEGEDVPTKPSDIKVTDTVSQTRFLTTIAKEHYGNFNLWPLIYEENKDILGHPDRIKPGTNVVVPSLSKYGIDPHNPEDIAKVKRQGAEIYARYKK